MNFLENSTIGLPFPPQEYLPDPGIRNPRALQVDCYHMSQQGFLCKRLKATTNLSNIYIPGSRLWFSNIFPKDLRIFMEMAGSWYKTMNIQDDTRSSYLHESEKTIKNS